MNESVLHDRLRANLDAVRAAIVESCRRSGRDPRDVRLVAVTKTVSLPVIRRLLELGVADLGENRVQQLVERGAEIAGWTDVSQPHWHMIGHLQRNKVKPLLDRSRFIHSVDSPRLAAEIQRHAAARDATIDVLIEVNVSGEARKEGIPRDQTGELLQAIAPLPNLRLRGLMTMAPLTDNPENARPHFASLRKLLAELRNSGACGPQCDQLSMGMSGDFRVAIEEGATVVRLGSVLFEGLS